MHPLFERENMSDKPLSFEVSGIGLIEMSGRGPWRAAVSGGTVEIRDADGRVANPTVHQPFSTTIKPNRNVIFAKAAHPIAIVEKANSLFQPAAPDTSNEVDG
jgi:hypothetical protein